MWEFMEAKLNLSKASSGLIEEYKKRYWRMYFREYKRKRRENHTQFDVNLDKDEEVQISLAANKHNLSRTGYIKKASLAYSTNTFLVPDRIQIAEIQQTLNMIHQEVKLIAGRKQRGLLEYQQQYEDMLRIIEGLEQKITDILSYPPTVRLFIEKIIQSNPEALSIIKELIQPQHDPQNHPAS